MAIAGDTGKSLLCSVLRGGWQKEVVHDTRSTALHSTHSSALSFDFSSVTDSTEV